MIISNGRVVSLSYNLRIDDAEGKLVETVTDQSPLQFIFGSGNLLPKFEENIKGLTQGDNFDFNLKSTDAYGDFNTDAVVDVPKNIFEVNGKMDENLVKIGNQIPMMDKSGNRFTGRVLEINTDSIKMDFNHPLAGNDLYFSGRVTNIREATEQELAHGLDNGGCGCNSGCDCDDESKNNCGDGCGDGCCG